MRFSEGGPSEGLVVVLAAVVAESGQSIKMCFVDLGPGHLDKIGGWVCGSKASYCWYLSLDRNPVGNGLVSSLFAPGCLNCHCLIKLW